MCQSCYEKLNHLINSRSKKEKSNKSCARQEVMGLVSLFLTNYFLPVPDPNPKPYHLLEASKVFPFPPIPRRNILSLASCIERNVVIPLMHDLWRFLLGLGSMATSRVADKKGLPKVARGRTWNLLICSQYSFMFRAEVGVYVAMMRQISRCLLQL